MLFRSGGHGEHRDDVAVVARAEELRRIWELEEPRSGRCRCVGDRATGNRRLRGGRRRGAVSLGGSERVRAAAVVLVVPESWPHGHELRARRPRRARPVPSPPCSPSQHWMSTRSRVPCRCRAFPFRGCLQELTDSLGGGDDQRRRIDCCELQFLDCRSSRRSDLPGDRKSTRLNSSHPV